jgi:hypothetical protein
MADFCKQCAEEMDFEADFTGQFLKRGLIPDGRMGFHALCEGCGAAHIIDDEGTCASPNCLKSHGGKKDE